MHFNPRSREGSDLWLLLSCIVLCNFNPRSREGSDIEDFEVKVNSIPISIHAPARGATTAHKLVISCSGYFNPRSREGSDRHRRRWRRRIWRNFNPRSREGSDQNYLLRLMQDKDFNPRSREGSDPWNVYPVLVGFVISIHAPARGATAC